MSGPAAHGHGHGATTQFGKYLLVERLGRGGMAEVWKARIVGPAGFQRTMVVKRILPHLVEDPHFVQMFVAEARLSARLNHANIVHVFELGDVDGEYFLAMEYVRGRDLVNVMRAQLLRGLPPPGLGAYVAREVCRALAYAHALTDDNGVPLRLIHRDVSPSNVMIGFDGAIKLLDFGIAKALAEANENKTQTGTLKGKFGYMAPEQVEGKDIDHRADLFAAGIVLHESLTGRRLFKGAHDLQTIQMVREARVDPPSALNAEVPPELDRICLKALARRPEDRYKSCDDMAIDLDQVAHGMKWGPERVTVLLRELFPDEPSNTGQLVMTPDQTIPSGLTIGSLRKAERRRRVAWMAAAVAMLGGIALLIAAKTGGPKKSATSAVAPAAAVAAPAPAPVEPALPKTVKVRVRSSPPGADVFLDGETKSRGKTPLDLVMPRADLARTLTLKLAGYRPSELDVPLDTDSTASAPLMPNMIAAAPPPAPAPKRPARAPAVRKSAPASPAPQRSRPDLQKGEIVDPFAR
jgi:serine/threonine protein kinase